MKERPKVPNLYDRLSSPRRRRIPRAIAWVILIPATILLLFQMPSYLSNTAILWSDKICTIIFFLAIIAIQPFFAFSSGVNLRFYYQAQPYPKGDYRNEYFTPIVKNSFAQFQLLFALFFAVIIVAQTSWFGSRFSSPSTSMALYLSVVGSLLFGIVWILAIYIRDLGRMKRYTDTLPECE